MISGTRGGDAIHVVQSEADLDAGFVAAGLLAGAAGKDADGVGAPLGKDRLDGVAEAVAVGEQQHDRGDAPGHADHGDGGAAAVEEHRLPGLGENVFEHEFFHLANLAVATSPVTLCAALRRGPVARLCRRGRGRRRPRKARAIRRPAPPTRAPVRGGSKPGILSVSKCLQQPHKRRRNGDADEAADAGEQEAFPEELRQDAAPGGAHRFEDADLAGRSVTETSMMLMMPTAPRPRVTTPTPPRKTSMAVKMTPINVCFLDGVPFIERVLQRGVEAVALGDDPVHGDGGGGVVILDGGLVLDRSERILRDVVALEGEQLLHGGDGNIDLLVVVGRCCHGRSCPPPMTVKSMSLMVMVSPSIGRPGNSSDAVLEAEERDARGVANVLIVEDSGPPQWASIGRWGNLARFR